MAMTARQIITARLGRDLGPLATMPRDLRRALYLLALQLQRMPKMSDHDHPDTDLTDPHGEAEALRRENARLKVKLDRREKLLDSVILERTHYRKRAEAAEAALATSRAPDPVVNAGGGQPGDLIARIAAHPDAEKIAKEVAAILVKHIPAAPVAEAQPVAWLQRHRLGPYILSGPDNTETDEWSAPFRVYAHPPEQPAIDRAQCCMCGKTGLSTAEDGGPECELSDGRWVCTAECYDRAVPQPTIGGAELDALSARLAGRYDDEWECLNDRLKAVAALRAQPDWKAMAEPDYCYNPEDWEYTQTWDARHELAESVLDYGRDKGPVRISTLISGPDKWVARVPLDTDGDGEADDWEDRWFDSEEAARAALSDFAKMKGE